MFSLQNRGALVSIRHAAASARRQRKEKAKTKGPSLAVYNVRFRRKAISSPSALAAVCSRALQPLDATKEDTRSDERKPRFLAPSARERVNVRAPQLGIQRDRPVNPSGARRGCCSHAAARNPACRPRTSPLARRGPPPREWRAAGFSERTGERGDYLFGCMHVYCARCVCIGIGARRKSRASKGALDLGGTRGFAEVRYGGMCAMSAV